MVQTFQLLPGVTLRCFRDHRFKQGCLSLQFVRPTVQQEVSASALIPSVLLRGCASAPDLRAITRRLDDLYGASVGPLVRRIGDYHTTGLYCGFIDDRYALDGDKILAPMMDFLRQLLLEPVMESGVFRESYVEGEKKNLISTIESQRNNKRSYAASQLLRHMCREDSFGIPRLGRVEDVTAITAESAWTHWQKVLRDSTVNLFYVGNAEPEQVAQLVLPLFDSFDRCYVNLPEQTPFHPCGGGYFTETMDVAQARLAIGYRTPVTLRDADFPAMQVCNTVLGGGMTGKLFMNIREKMSLCYDISSGYHGSKGLLYISAGIDQSKEDVVLEEIGRQLTALRSGDITENELLSAKESLCNSLRGAHDSLSAIEHYYSTAALSGLTLTPAQYLEKVQQVTAAQVAEAAQSLTEDTTYFLKGVQ